MPQLICHAAELPLRRVSAEVPRRASRRLRIAGALLYATARQFLELAVWIDKHHLVPIRALVFVSASRYPTATRNISEFSRRMGVGQEHCRSKYIPEVSHPVPARRRPDCLRAQ